MSGDVFVVGWSESNNFPNTVGGAQASYAGNRDGVILRIRPSLNNQPLWGGFVQATYIGGGNVDELRSLKVANNQVYAVGETTSTDLPNNTGAIPTYQGGPRDAFVLRIDLGLSSGLVVSYFGGNNEDGGFALEVGPTSVYIAGITRSTNLPATAGAAFPSLNAANDWDGFIARFDLALATVLRSTYYGGTNYDEILDIGLQPGTGHLGAVGRTLALNLPTTAGAYQASPSPAPDSQEAFAALFAADLSALQAATYLGGSQSQDIAYALAFGASGEFFIGGGARNFDDTTAGTVQPSYTGGIWEDGFIVRLDASLQNLMAGTMLGGAAHQDTVSDLLVLPNGDVVAVGWTFSNDFLSHAGASNVSFGFQNAHGGSYDAFVVRLPPILGMRPRVTSADQERNTPTGLARIRSRGKFIW